MTTRIVEELHCDLCGHAPGEGEQVSHHTFAIGTASYEIDLCDAHLAMFDRDTAPYEAHGRLTGQPPARPVRNTASRQRSATIRRWWQHHPELGADPGHGRLPSTVTRAWEAAQRANCLAILTGSLPMQATLIGRYYEEVTGASGAGDDPG